MKLTTEDLSRIRIAEHNGYVDAWVTLNWGEEAVWQVGMSLNRQHFAIKDEPPEYCVKPGRPFIKDPDAICMPQRITDLWRCYRVALRERLEVYRAKDMLA